MDFSSFASNPMIQKYLFAMGAGMMNQPTFLYGLGNGVREGNATAIDDIQGRQEAAAEMAAFKARQQAEYEAGVNMYKFKRDDARTEAERTALGYVPILKEMGVDEELIRNMPADVLNQIGDAIIKQQFTPDKDTKWQLQSNPVTGEMYMFNPSDPSQTMPFGGQSSASQQSQSAPSGSPSAPPGWNTGFLPEPANPLQGKMNYEKQLQIAAEQEKMQAEAQAKRIEEAKQFVSQDQTYNQSHQSINDSFNRMSSSLEGDNQFRNNDWLWKNLPDNKLVNNIRTDISTDPNMGNLEREVNSSVFDKIKEMSSAGSSSKIFDSNAERQALNSTIMDPTTPYETKKAAIQQLRRKSDEAAAIYQAKRAEMYSRLGLPVPEQGASAMPKTKVIQMNTGNKPVGSTGTINGKRIRVVAPNQIEVLD